MRHIRYLSIAALILAILIGAYAGFVEPNWIQLKHLHLETLGLTDSLSGKIGIHLSDLHIGSIGKREEQILGIIAELEPDLVFLTGDYVKWKGSYEPALEFLRMIAGKGANVWAVMGDYDYSRGRQSCRFCHRPNSGVPTDHHRVTFLRNSFDAVAGLKGDFVIGGIDREFQQTFDGVKERFKQASNYPAIILAHNPIAFDSLDKSRPVLVLAGDTHGGQMPLPAWLWQLMGYEKNAKYNRGVYKEGKKVMYVNRGIGTSKLPFRFLCRPEITVIHF